MKCIKCGQELDAFAEGAHKKLVDRSATEYLCVPCIAEKFKVTEEFLREKIEHFRRMGCTLFPPLDK